MKTVAVILASFASLALAGCLGDPGGVDPSDPDPTNPDPNDPDPTDPDPTVPDPDPTPLTAPQFVHDYNVKICTFAHACFGSAPDPGQFTAMYGATQAECITLKDTEARIPSIEGSISAGRIVWNVNQANSCLASLVMPASCTGFFTAPELPSSCSQALSGTAADGELCAVSYDCLNEDSICDIEQNLCVAIGPVDDGAD